MEMERLCGPMIRFSYCVAKKKRSNFRRRPCPNPKPVIYYQNGHALCSSQTDNCGHEDNSNHHHNGRLRSPEFEDYSLHSTNYVKPGENHLNKLMETLVESDHLGNVNRPRKVKLKLSGITRTHQTKSLSEIAMRKEPVGVSSVNTSDDHADLQKQDCAEVGAREISFRVTYYDDGHTMNKTSKKIYKSFQISKKRAIDDEFDDEADEEIRYLKKLKASKAHSGVRLGKDGRKKGRIHEDYDKKTESQFDDELKNKKIVDDIVDPHKGSAPEMTITTRKRALECPESCNLVDFPNGLPPAPSKKQQLSEVEQQLRKAEALQRRRLQAEKAAKEAEAEAIRKILGQDSNRKKKEEKLKKQQELTREKMSKAAVLGSNTVRWIMGPHGTVVTFSDDVGLPKIFCSQPYRYPPPREKCVGPNCMNDYRYRDSKSKLPLCSLQCYKAVHENTEPLPAC